MAKIYAARKFTVDRRTWDRGGKSLVPKLLNFQGTRCCVGFYAKQCGISDKRMFNIATLDDSGVRDFLNPTLKKIWIGSEHMITVDAIYQTNDNTRISDKTREERLTKLFASIGVTVEFIN